MRRFVFGLAAFVTAVAGGSARADFHSDACYAPGALVLGDFVLGPTSPGKWGNPVMGTPGGTVTWSIMAGGIATDSGTSVAMSSVMPAGFLTQIQNAFAAWSAVADIQFVQVADSGLPFNAAGAGADIRIGAHAFDGPNGTLAHGFYPPANGVTAAGDIHFDSAELWKIGFGGPGFDIFQVAAHEIGHAIGLNHTGVANSLMNPFYTEAFSGLQADDIAGGQFIYGRAITPNAVPAPPALLLAGIGAITSLSAFRRRRAAA